jgi:hypothetical protein
MIDNNYTSNIAETLLRQVSHAPRAAQVRMVTHNQLQRRCSTSRRRSGGLRQCHRRRRGKALSTARRAAKALVISNAHGAGFGHSAGVTGRQFFNDFNVSWNVF